MTELPVPDVCDMTRTPLTAELTGEEMKAFYANVETRHLETGDVLIQQDACDDCMYVIKSGELVVTKEAGQGEGQTLGTLGTGDFTGAMGCLDGNPHSATLRATEKTDVYVISRGKLEALLDTHPQLVFKLMRSIIQSLHCIIRQMDQYHVDFINYITKLHGRY